MSFKFSSFLLTVLPLIFLLKFSDYYISSFLILKIINCMCEMSHWMSFEVDRYSSAWAHIALCADLTWATEPPDEFIIANQVSYRKFLYSLLLCNKMCHSASFSFWYDVFFRFQRLWTQHCRVSQVLQDTSLESQSLQTNNQCELTGQNWVATRIYFLYGVL